MSMTQPIPIFVQKMLEAFEHTIRSRDYLLQRHSPQQQAWLLTQNLADAIYADEAIIDPQRNYIPPPKKLHTYRMLNGAALEEALRAEFNGRNYQELAQKYGLSPRYVMRIINENRHQKRRGKQYA